MMMIRKGNDCYGSNASFVNLSTCPYIMEVDSNGFLMRDIQHHWIYLADAAFIPTLFKRSSFAKNHKTAIAQATCLRAVSKCMSKYHSRMHNRTVNPFAATPPNTLSCMSCTDTLTHMFTSLLCPFPSPPFGV